MKYIKVKIFLWLFCLQKFIQWVMADAGLNQQEYMILIDVNVANNQM